VQRFEASAQPACLDELHAALDRLWREAPDVEAPARMRFATAVSEVLGNVVVHGRMSGGETPTVRVSLAARPDRLRAELLDDGVALAPGAAATELPEDDLAESGRGLALARAALDELHDVREDSGNRWELVIRRPA
jgi:serine/threonine-protein kinase RsbW